MVRMKFGPFGDIFIYYSLTPVHPEKLPSMSITATSWWPETTPRLGSSPLL